MGRIGNIKSILKSVIREAKVWVIKADIGSQLTTSALFGPGGEDSPPLDTDDVLLVELKSSGTYAASGSLDHKNQQLSSPGEKRIYARNPSGDEVCQVHLKNDGSIRAGNQNGFIEILANGNVSINGVIFDTSQEITDINEATIGGIPFTTHIHQQGNDSDGDVEVPTDGPEAPP